MNGEIGCSVMCRACMKVDGVLLPMYGDYTISKKNFPDKLADLASIQIDEYDGLPSVLCAKCAYRTDAFHEFKLQVQATEKKLRKMFQCPIKQSVSSEPVFVAKTSDPDEICSREETSIDADYTEQTEILFKQRTKDNPSESTARNDSSDDMAIFESLDFIEAENHDRANIDDFSNSDEILIAQTNNDENSLIVKEEFSHEITDILHSESVDYTFLYTSENNEIDQSNSEIVPINLKNGISTCEIDSKMLNDTSNDEKSFEYVTEDSKNSRKFVVNERNNENFESPKTIAKTEARLSLKNCKILHAEATTNVIEDPESDYSIDLDENLVGSLNDTITRIREIKNEGQATIYQCTLCMENYEKLTGILIHTVDTHVPKSGPFFCVVCEKDCSSHRDLRKHVKTHSGKYPYTCFVCNKAYSRKRYLKRHMSCHTDLPRHRCPKCGERFNQKNELETHLGTHVYKGPPFACSQCPRVFNHKGNYKRHLISHLDPKGIHLPKYPCEICGKRFLNNRTLQTHIRVHTGEKPFECDICKRSFSQRGNLLNHQRIHYNPRSYTCEVCGKRFNQRATLRDHGLLHTGEKPYVCNVCGVAFTFSAALRRHMWSHATDKPFGCEICNARFVGKYDIKRHMKIHTDRPKIKRKRRTRNEDNNCDNESNELTENVNDFDDGTNIFIQEVFIEQHSGQIDEKEDEDEKENVDALLKLIEYE